MSNESTPIANNNEEYYHLKLNSVPSSVDTVSLGKGMMGLFLILTFLNMILAVTNGFYSLRITKKTAQTV